MQKACKIFLQCISKSKKLESKAAVLSETPALSQTWTIRLKDLTFCLFFYLFRLGRLHLHIPNSWTLHPWSMPRSHILVVKMVHQVQCALFQTVVQLEIYFVCLFATCVFSTLKFQDDLHQQSSSVFCSSGQLKTRVLYEELF